MPHSHFKVAHSVGDAGEEGFGSLLSLISFQSLTNKMQTQSC